ncbi:MdBV-4-2 [Microplitis demolitor]|nr:MdBV-4-2 [Microplitis demolitor]
MMNSDREKLIKSQKNELYRMKSLTGMQSQPLLSKSQTEKSDSKKRKYFKIVFTTLFYLSVFVLILTGILHAFTDYGLYSGIACLVISMSAIIVYLVNKYIKPF